MIPPEEKLGIWGHAENQTISPLVPMARLTSVSRKIIKSNPT